MTGYPKSVILTSHTDCVRVQGFLYVKSTASIWLLNGKQFLLKENSNRVCNVFRGTPSLFRVFPDQLTLKVGVAVISVKTSSKLLSVFKAIMLGI